MSRDRLPLIGPSGSRAARPSFSSPSLQRPHQAGHRKYNQQQMSSSSTSSHPSSILLSDAAMTPWEGLAHVESSFTFIPPTLPPPRPPPPPPPPPPPFPLPTPTTHEEDEERSSSSFNSEIPSPCLVVPQNNAGGARRCLRMRRKAPPQRRAPRPPRLPPLHPVTNLSFSRSFTFSFFELPLHLSPHSRAEHVKNLCLLLKQIHY